MSGTANTRTGLDIGDGDTAAGGAHPRAFADGRYPVRAEVGRGGMGVVYLCDDELLHRRVAIKVIGEEIRRNPEAIACFLEEARALAGLAHPHLVALYDACHRADVTFLVMEYVDGRSLDDMLLSGRIAGAPTEAGAGAVPDAATGANRVASPGAAIDATQGIEIRRGCALGAQIAEALAYCHGRGILHRDVKPANVLVDTDGRARLVDFGIARSLEVLARRATEIRGTPAYMAPEQITGEELGPATDVYALGCTLYEMLSGRLPFTTGHAWYHHLHTEPAPPSMVRPGLPPAIDALVGGCMRKRASDRPTATQVAQVLRALAGEDESRAPARPIAMGTAAMAMAPALAVSLPATDAPGLDHAPSTSNRTTATAREGATATTDPAVPKHRGGALIIGLALAGALLTILGLMAAIISRATSSTSSPAAPIEARTPSLSPPSAPVPIQASTPRSPSAPVPIQARPPDSPPGRPSLPAALVHPPGSSTAPAAARGAPSPATIAVRRDGRAPSTGSSKPLPSVPTASAMAPAHAPSPAPPSAATTSPSVSGAPSSVRSSVPSPPAVTRAPAPSAVAPRPASPVPASPIAAPHPPAPPPTPGSRPAPTRSDPTPRPIEPEAPPLSF